MIALIAGTGGLPPHLVDSLMLQGRVPLICEMRGFVSEVQGEFTRIPFRIETLATFLQTLTNLGVTQVCMAGAMQRPEMDPSAIDAATAPLVPRLQAAMGKGDDGTLREIIAIFQERGFEIVGAHQIALDLMPMAGVYTKVAPPPMEQALAQAKAALVDMGAADLGQAMLLRDGAVIAREDARGTAAMLKDLGAPLNRDGHEGDPFSAMIDTMGDLLGDAADWLSGRAEDDALPGAGAVLVKAPKPDQNMLADMPLIGPDTAKQAAEAGLAGIVIPVRKVLVLDFPQVVSILDMQKMFLWVAPEGTL